MADVCGGYFLLLPILASALISTFAKDEQGMHGDDSDTCSEKLIKRFDVIERKIDILLRKLCDRDQDADMICGDLLGPTVTPDPYEGPTTTKFLPTAYPDLSSPPPVSSTTLNIRLVVARGHEAKLPCPVQNPNVQIKWYFYSDLLTVGYYVYSLDLRMGIQRPRLLLWYLNIASVTMADQGVYTCVAGGKTIRIQLSVVDPLYTEVSAKDGSSLSLECPLTKTENGTEQLSITWKDSAATMVGRGNSTNATLIVDPVTQNLWFTHVTRQSGGNYTCSVDGEYNPRGIFNLNIDVETAPPTFVLSHTSDFIEVSHGKNVTVTCKATGKPCPTMTWRHSYGDVAETSACIGDARNGSLELLDFRLALATVTCVATNAYGEIEKDIVVLLKGAPPMIDKAPRDVTTVHGQLAIFQCHAIGNPMPKIWWEKTNPGESSAKKISSVSKRYTIATSVNGESILVINAVRLRMNGTQFKCVAQSSTVIAKESALLNVHRLDAQLAVLPHVAIHMDVRFIDKGKTIEITCYSKNAEGCRGFTWYKDDFYLVEDPRISVVDTDDCQSVLTIANAVIGDKGMYRCSATNVHGIGYSDQINVVILNVYSA